MPSKKIVKKVIKDVGVKNKNSPIIYQAKNGAIELRGDFGSNNLWATQAQIAEVFNVERSVITKHIRNILKDNELKEGSVCAKFAHTADDGKTYQTQFYNLDIILSVGYRTNSVKAIEFRKWSSKILKEHLIKGYTINKKQIQKNYEEFLKNIESIQSLLPENVSLDPKAILELVKEFSNTWLSLDAYDKEELEPVGENKKSITLKRDELMEGIFSLRDELIKTDNATEIFAQERVRGSVEGIIGNVMQTFDGASIYKTVEEKAAHLLYFMVKNHPFVDGNKRSGAFAFIWFLRKEKIKNYKNINPSALTAITLLIAESDPKRKSQMTALVTQMLK